MIAWSQRIDLRTFSFLNFIHKLLRVGRLDYGEGLLVNRRFDDGIYSRGLLNIERRRRNEVRELLNVLPCTTDFFGRQINS